MFSEAVPLWVFKSRKIRLRCKGLKYSTKGVWLAPSDLIFRPWAVFYVYDLYKSFHPADFRPPVIHNHLKPLPDDKIIDWSKLKQIADDI